MINIDNVNYGALYSFEPDFLKHVTEEVTPHDDEDETASYHLDKTDTTWSGILVTLVFLLMIGLIFSLTTSVSKNSIARLSGSNIAHTAQH